MSRDVLGLVGGGEIGTAIAARIGPRSTVLIASRNRQHTEPSAALRLDRPRNLRQRMKPNHRHDRTFDEWEMGTPP